MLVIFGIGTLRGDFEWKELGGLSVQNTSTVMKPGALLSSMLGLTHFAIL